MDSTSPSSPPRLGLSARDWLVRLLQLVASLAVLWALGRELDLERLQAVFSSRRALAWLALGLGIKAFSVWLHEVRLWLAFEAPRPPMGKVVQVGFVAAAVNLVLPARAGDVAAIGLLHTRCGVSPARATAAVGLVNFLEIAVFGLVVLWILLTGADRWTLLLGAPAHAQALQLMTLVTLGSVAAAVVLVVLAGRLGAPPEEPPPGPSPVALLREIVRTAGSSLGSRRWLAWQGSTSLLQAVCMIATFVIGFEVAGLEVALPWLAASGIMAMSALTAVVLPPSFGAGPAAASVAVLTLFGVDQSGALLYAAAWWILANLPSAALGLPAMWTLRPAVEELGAGGQGGGGGGTGS